MLFGDNISWDAHVAQILEDEKRGIPVYHKEDEDLRLAKSYISTYTNPLSFRAIDVGCHMGRWCDVVTSLGMEYSGFDQSLVALEYARKQRPNLSWHQGMLWDMKFKNEFDLAFCVAVLQHNTLAEQERIFPRVYVALKSGGVFYMTESTVPVATRTQRTSAGWVDAVCSVGFRLIDKYRKNDMGLEDKYIFIK